MLFKLIRTGCNSKHSFLSVVSVDAKGAICGNMVVEQGEECDCGFAEDESCKTDICCEGRSMDSGCTLLPGKNCRLVLFFVCVLSPTHQKV